MVLICLEGKVASILGRKIKNNTKNYKSKCFHSPLLHLMQVPAMSEKGLKTHPSIPSASPCYHGCLRGPTLVSKSLIQIVKTSVKAVLELCHPHATLNNSPFCNTKSFIFKSLDEMDNSCSIFYILEFN